MTLATAVLIDYLKIISSMTMMIFYQLFTDIYNCTVDIFSDTGKLVEFLLKGCCQNELKS